METTGIISLFSNILLKDYQNRTSYVINYEAQNDTDTNIILHFL